MLQVHLAIGLDRSLGSIKGSLRDEKRDPELSRIDSGATHVIVMIVGDEKRVGGLGGPAVRG
jgi:hypothetical protein